MISLIASAVALSLQLEAGMTSMAHPVDDTYIDYHLPGADNAISYTTASFGAALRADTTHARVALGWRNLGNEHMAGNLIEDVDYFACRAHPSTCGKPFEHWVSGGSTQQLYFEAGYKLHFSNNLVLVPSAGIADTRIGWHTTITGQPWHVGPECHRSLTQWDIGPFVGLSLEHGPLGLGAFLLNTAPNRATDPWYPGQGSHSLYFRATLAVGP